MKILTWNWFGRKMYGYQKIGAGSEVEVLLHETNKVTWSKKEVRKLWPDDEFDFRMVESDGRAGGLISIWDTNCFRAESEIVNSIFFLITGKWIQSDTLVNLINMYVPCVASNQLSLWNELIILKSTDSAFWLAGGDFNTTRNQSERSNCSGPRSIREDFNNFITSFQLVDLPLIGEKITWFGPQNKRSRLDRFLL
ncbi:hypothetical protein GQ457_07G011560 [Hibiscus cannabinus]